MTLCSLVGEYQQRLHNAITQKIQLNAKESVVGLIPLDCNACVNTLRTSVRILLELLTTAFLCFWYSCVSEVRMGIVNNP